MQIAENFYKLAAKRLARGGSGTEFAAHDPGLQLFPVFRGRPAVVLLPFSFFRAVPVTFVAATESLFLLGEPTRIGFYAGVRDLRQRGLFSLGAGIDAETEVTVLAEMPT
jgi:hypothetical protein